MILPNRPDGEPDALLGRPLEEHQAVAQDTMPEEGRCVVQHDQIEQGRRDDPSEAAGEPPHDRPLITARRVGVEQHANVVVAVVTGIAARAAPEQVPEPHLMRAGEHLPEPIDDGICAGRHRSERYLRRAGRATRTWGQTPWQFLRRRSLPVNGATGDSARGFTRR